MCTPRSHLTTVYTHLHRKQNSREIHQDVNGGIVGLHAGIVFTFLYFFFWCLHVFTHEHNLSSYLGETFSGKTKTFHKGSFRRHTAGRQELKLCFPKRPVSFLAQTMPHNRHMCYYSSTYLCFARNSYKKFLV